MKSLDFLIFQIYRRMNAPAGYAPNGGIYFSLKRLEESAWQDEVFEVAL